MKWREGIVIFLCLYLSLLPFWSFYDTHDAWQISKSKIPRVVPVFMFSMLMAW